MGGGNPSGLKVVVDTRWVSGNGYRPIRLTIKTSSGQIVAADRELRFELSFRYFNSSGRRITVDEVVSTFVTLPEGKSEIKATVRMLQRSKWNALEIRVYEEDVLRQDLSANIDLSVRRNVFGWSESVPRILFVSSKAGKFDEELPSYSKDVSQREIPDVRILSSLFPGNMYYSLANHLTKGLPVSDEEAVSIIEEWQNSMLLHPDDLPVDFIDYSCFEWIVMKRSDMLQLQRDRTAAWAAIRMRLTAGAVLMVCEVDEAQAEANPMGLPPTPNKLEEIDAALLADFKSHQTSPQWTRHQGYLPVGIGVPGFTANDSAFQLAVRARAEFRFSPLKLEKPVNVRSRRNFPCTVTYGQVEELEMIGHRLDPGTPEEPIRFDRPYSIREAGMGKVVAFSGDPFPGRTFHWATLVSHLQTSRWSWRSQTGMSLNTANRDFWTLFIPGVGTAPVVTFLVLITLFAFAIGPINYFVLRHLERLHLILVTVPVGAVLVIIALVTYAFFSEGFGVRARSRSVTILDQANETAVGWARQNYYAGLGASRSLAFDKDTVVYPVHFYPNRPDSDQKRQVYWEDRQYLEEGFLETRAQAQVVLCRACKSTARLDVTEQNGKVNVVNQLGATMTHLYLVDSKGAIHAGEQIANGAESILVPSTPNQRSETLREISGENTPELPVGFNANLYRSGQTEFYFSIRSSDSMLPSPSMKVNALEKYISEVMFQSGGKGGQKVYVAVLEQAAHIPLVTEGVADENGFHVVVGTYE